MYQKLKLRDKNGNLLKHYHHTYLQKDFIQDCMIWKQFLQSSDDRLNLCRPFIDFSPKPQLHSETLFFYSDASLNKNFGMGAVFKDMWLQGNLNANFIQEQKPSIEFLELFALTIAMVSWSESYNELHNCRITIFCDNKAVVNMVNNMASSCPQCQKLIRILVLGGIKFNRKVTVRHVRSKQNTLSDALSRRFWRYAPPTMSKQPSAKDECLWPLERIWFDEADYIKSF